MKKFLPTANTRGFTLIELMVVVVIIAILSIVGISLFTTAQKNARDGVRRVELTGLAKSIESTKDPNSGNYKYTDTLYGDDFPQIKARDPLKSTSAPYYCVAAKSTGAPAAPAATEWGSGANCPTVTGETYVYLVNESGAYNNTVPPAATANPLQSGAVKYWRICTRLEVSGDPFCIISNKQ